ncbi:hypothetical protein HK105_206341 [Polyrhizophydium stewartii]|uniref:Uncharacterized protein n=1 Tax=Polyrhizophydium stewartii TaxID=2732419 RepID=A0ABR4N3M2_9FUNG
MELLALAIIVPLLPLYVLSALCSAGIFLLGIPFVVLRALFIVMRGFTKALFNRSVWPSLARWRATLQHWAVTGDPWSQPPADTAGVHTAHFGQPQEHAVFPPAHGRPPAAPAHARRAPAASPASSSAPTTAPGQALRTAPAGAVAWPPSPPKTLSPPPATPVGPLPLPPHASRAYLHQQLQQHAALAARAAQAAQAAQARNDSAGAAGGNSLRLTLPMAIRSMPAIQQAPTPPLPPPAMAAQHSHARASEPGHPTPATEIGRPLPAQTGHAAPAGPASAGLAQVEALPAMVAADIAGLLSRAAEVAGDMDLAGQASDAEGDASDGSGTPELAPEELAKQRRIERERHQALLAQLDTFEMASVLSALDSLVSPGAASTASASSSRSRKRRSNDPPPLATQPQPAPVRMLQSPHAGSASQSHQRSELLQGTPKAIFTLSPGDSGQHTRDGSETPGGPAAGAAFSPQADGAAGSARSTASSSRGDSVAPTEADTTDAAKLLFMLRGASQADLLGNADDTAAGGGADAMGSASEGESSGPGSPVGAPDAGGSLLNSMLLAASQYDAGALDPRQPPLA